MTKLRLLKDRILSRIQTNLKEFDFDINAITQSMLDFDKLSKFYCFYGITAYHPIDFNFRHACMSGSYFLGKCYVNQSIIYKCDIRGDELKREGDIMDRENPLPLVEDETIVISSSLLYKTLVHSNSHNPETPEEFTIRNTISGHYANIHGSTLAGCYLAPFSTVDMMNLHSCVLGEFSYIQAGEFFHKKIDPGQILIQSDAFSFTFKHGKEVIEKYIGVNAEGRPRGRIYEFVSARESDYERLFKVMELPPIETPQSSAVNRYAVIKGDTRIGENVLVSQRAFLEDAHMGNGSNAQENTYIIDSDLIGMNVTAHGGKIIHAEIGQKTFVGFNSFLYGKPDARLTIGKNCIVMPHTIIDIEKPLVIPDDCIIWGYIANEKDLETHTVSIKQLDALDGELKLGKMLFKGKGRRFVEGFGNRIESILTANGAYCNDDEELRGHAQEGQQISFNTLQPYPAGENKGLYPSIRILP